MALGRLDCQTLLCGETICGKVPFPLAVYIYLAVISFSVTEGRW